MSDPKHQSPHSSISNHHSLAAYHYVLPPECIAQTPARPRDHSRLLAVTSPTQHQHHRFRDLPDLLQPGDLLILNDTQVIPARLWGHKPAGAAVEVLLLEPQKTDRWLALVKPGRRLKPGATIHFGSKDSEPDLIAQVIATDADTNGRWLQFTTPKQDSLETVLQRLGQVPLPPYITHTDIPAEHYQTIYAEKPGAVAAPTAGLHFTPELFARLDQAGIQRAFITLHVGVGTFRPVETDNITQHTMHSEWVDVPPSVVKKIQTTHARGHRVIAVGTTVVRALEGAAQSGTLRPFRGKTNLFIYPGYKWQVIDGLITNFHLPGSSLLMLVSALIGRQRLLGLYQEAITSGYRFYSFGDAMIILPTALTHHKFS
ncbi:S-adenosylmethionine:tRNA ribosyltransferase-isomerase [Halomicronema hongdechloris C2206]|uniref:S-adenosylmethionine:tRNA ribosyltransferase-isomerase n=1 Tax=Halomicronema hongdechloris C2206 TaxID=1641165 RepID=A0A1Z3HR32_9CYAN|nr:tRNA preQ1(34) S-adenosylmethionine ribosyltransferase-isomerase QueA [Halomicronema hongdechloris]ASC72789.1 S-adenosylmethionine:tRNA ribosyltransferase-isomerase [Halomicronema hongdechloris C2206]